MRSRTGRSATNRARHYGLLFFTNDTFARHRHDLFVSQILAALESALDAHPDDDDSAWIRWLTRPST